MIVTEFTVRLSGGRRPRRRVIVCKCDNPAILAAMIKSHPQNFWLYDSEVILVALGRLVDALQLNLLGMVPRTKINKKTLIIYT